MRAVSLGCVNGTPAPFLGIRAVDQRKTGRSYTLDFSSVANDFIVVFVSPRLVTVESWPLLTQPSWLDDQLSVSVGELVTDATGAATQTWQGPNNSSLINQTMWWKGIGGFRDCRCK